MNKPAAIVAAALWVTACGGSKSGTDAGGDSGSVAPDGGGVVIASDGGVQRAVTVARTTAMPACTTYVDGAAAASGDGSRSSPWKTIAEAITAAANDAVICVAQGTYAEALTAGEKPFRLAGGFQRGFAARDSAQYTTKMQGNGSNTFFRIVDPGPPEGSFTAIDGFEITGYSQGIVRNHYYAQRLDVTNNDIHDNTCASDTLVGGGFSLTNVSGTISGNVIARNTCSRGGGGFLGEDPPNLNDVTFLANRVDGNSGNELAGDSHGGGLYLFGSRLTITGNEFTRNRANGWGGGLYVGAYSGGGQRTTAALTWNVYRDNRADDFGGGFFCDDSARCVSDHEVYERNCAGNIFLDSGPDGAEPTIATFDHLTSVAGLSADCSAPGAGVIINKANTAADSYSFVSSIFWGNEANRDFDASCQSGCANVTVNVTYSDVNTTYANGGVTITFGAGNLASVDPRFVDVAGHDLHLMSTKGHFTPAGPVNDAVDSPALAKGDPARPAPHNPARAGTRSELGAYGNSAEASFVQ